MKRTVQVEAHGIDWRVDITTASTWDCWEEEAIYVDDSERNVFDCLAVDVLEDIIEAVEEQRVDSIDWRVSA